jgi:gamma-glutamyl hercynylcysteine S-oxide synthase
MPATQADVFVQSHLLERILDARRRSDELFDIVRSDSIYERPIPQRHRIIFYVGHLEAFDWNLLHENVLGLKSFDRDLDRLFAFGIDPVGGGLPSDQPSDWPSLGRVHEYVARIRADLDAKLSEVAEPRGRDGFALATLLNVAIEHRLMHVETLAYMLHQLSLEKKKTYPSSTPIVTPPFTNRMIRIPAGPATLGLPRESEEFGWDNEYEIHTVSVPAFEIDQFKVTNGDFVEFIASGGYENHLLWSDDDWNWKSAQGISHPAFWKQFGDQWFYRGMFEEIRLPLSWPVYVSHAEAAAFARWKGKSLPTEAEWHRAAHGTVGDERRIYPWGNDALDRNHGNFDFYRWDPVPVNAFPEGRSAFGIEDMLGNGWEWTATTFAPFPGFEPFPFYRGYSADFFDGKHFVMKGASPRTAACMLRPTFRNWFQAHYQYMYAGFRCVSH